MGYALVAQDVCFAYPRVGRSRSRRAGSDTALAQDLVVRDVSLHLEAAQTLGVIGGNGSGKSTLLKLAAGILEPQSGDIHVSGRVAPLIELGAGFDPELTVRENVILYGALLGLPVRRIKEQTLSILQWAGVAHTSDWPLRVLSSGMMSRLAFSVATAVDADLLLVDEVLSVGDLKFQEISRQRMRDRMRSGASVVLVSHDLGFVREMADSVVWLDRGEIRMVGEPHTVIHHYSQDV